MDEQSTQSGGFEILAGERLDDLVRGGLKIIQSPGNFCFSMDAVLLANFATVKKGDRVLDLATGTGVIPLLISARSAATRIFGMEIQPESAGQAVRSVRGNGLENLIQIIHGDLREADRLLGTGCFDLVVSNPPYLPVGRGSQNQKESITIARHEVFCSLQELLRTAARQVKYGGRVAVVHRPERLAELIVEMTKNHLKPRRLQLVFPGPGKQPNMVLLEAQSGGNPELQILEPFFVYDEKGRYTRLFWETYYPGLPYPETEADSNGE